MKYTLKNVLERFQKAIMMNNKSVKHGNAVKRKGV